MRPVKKKGERRRQDGDLKSSDDKRDGLSARKQQKVAIERKKKEKWPLEKTEKKKEGYKDSGVTVKTDKVRKPMGFQELMNLAKQQKDGDFKMKERETSKRAKETGKSNEQIPSASKPYKRLHKPVLDRDGKRREGEKIQNEKSVSNSVTTQHAEVVGKRSVEQTASAVPKCTVSSRTIDKSPHQLLSHRQDKRGRETGREDVKSKKLHDNPYLSLDDFPVNKTHRDQSVKKKKRLASDEFDFIDDTDVGDVDVSSHIREIFGYDKQKSVPCVGDMKLWFLLVYLLDMHLKIHGLLTWSPAIGT